MDERAQLPMWLREWAGEHLDADGPPPTPEPDQIAALADSLGFVRTEPAASRSRLIDRIRAAIGRWR